MKRSFTVLAVLGALPLAGCSDGGGDAAASAAAEGEAKVAITSAVVKRDDAGRLVTALRGTATPGAILVVGSKRTRANPDGTWALRTTYDRTRGSISVRALADGYADGAADVSQPTRPKLRVLSSTGVTTTSDLTVLKGRVSVSRGALGKVRVTVDGAPATVTGSRWTKTVTLTKGTRRFRIRASRPGADGGQLQMRKTRKLSEFEKAERKARRDAARRAREAAKQARLAAEQNAEAAEEGAGYGGCDPSYSGACLEEGAGDYDCAGGSGDGPNYVSGPITVTGSDPYDLDRDGDGVACENG
ncbi:MAG: hypothetical protein PGN13_00870 [Patulibacter minatonensis]